MIHTILQDTTWTGTIDLDGTVQVAEGVTLTISKGSTVNGNGNWASRIDVWGSLIVDGQAGTVVNINDVHIDIGNDDPTKPATIDIDFAHIKGGSLANGYGRGVVSLTDSWIDTWNIATTAYQPTSDWTIARNIFKDITGFNIWTYVGPTTGGTVSFENNLFYDEDFVGTNGWYSASPLIQVSNTADWGGGDSTVLVSKNSFMNTERIALGTTTGGNAKKVNAQSNWFNTTNMVEINARVLDRNDDLNYPSVIDIGGSLSAADPNTPTANNIPSYETRIETSEYTVILQDTTWTGTIDLDGTVQVAEGVTLTISKGSTVNGNGNWASRIDVWGSLIVDGQAGTVVNINDVHIDIGNDDPTKPATIDIDFAHIKGGSLANGYGRGVVSLTDSWIDTWNIATTAYQPTSDWTIARNIFKDITGFNIWTYVGPTTGGTVSFENNLFYDEDFVGTNGWYSASPLIQVSNTADWGGGDSTVLVSKNSFMNTERIALGTTTGGNAKKVNAQSNWFNTTNMVEINARVLDRNDDLNYPSVIDIGGSLSAADPNTPTVYFPNMKTVTLGSSFDTATDLGTITNLDEKWITFSPNGDSKGFFKVSNNLTFGDYDQFFLRILGDDDDNYGVRFYDPSGANLSELLPTSKGSIDFGAKSQNQAKTGESYYSPNDSVVEIYETTGKAITSDITMISQHFSPKTLSSSGIYSDSGQYNVPTGAQIYTGESLYSLINSDGIKLAVSKSQPAVIVLKQDISQVIDGLTLSDIKKSSTVAFGFQGFDAEDAKKVKIKAYDKVTGLSLDVASQSVDFTEFNTTGVHALFSSYAAGSNDIVVEITTEENGFTNGWFLVEPWMEMFTEHGNLYPDQWKSTSSKAKIFGSLGPDDIRGYGDDNVISGWTGNDLISTGTSDVADYKGTDSDLADDFYVYPYTGNDIIGVQRNLNNFQLCYNGIHYPSEALEIIYDKNLDKYLVKGESFTDWINVYPGIDLNEFVLQVGSLDTKTQPITISSANNGSENFGVVVHSSPDLWEPDRVSDKFIGDSNIFDLLMIYSAKSDLSGYKDLVIGVTSENNSLKASTTLTSGSTKEILNFSNVDLLMLGDGNDTVDMALETVSLFAQGGNDIITTSSGADFADGGTGDDTIIFGIEGVWGLDNEAWNINDEGIIYYKVPIDGKNQYQDIVFGGEGTDTLNMLGSKPDAIFFHDVISGAVQSNHVMTSSSLQILEKARITQIENINTGPGDDVIDFTSPDYKGTTFSLKLNGDTGNDVLWGNKGDDQLNGGDGDDLLFGGEGQDHLTGGIGKDVFEFAAETLTSTPPHDVIADYNKSQGDLIRFYVQTNDTQNLTISGTNELTWQTSTSNQTIHLNGVTLSSLNDINTEFVVVPAEKANRYVIHDSTNGWTLANLVGTEEGDLFMGSSGIDKIMGGRGSDTIEGYGGADIIYSGYDNDYVYGGSGDDRINTGKGKDKVYGGAGIDTIYAGDGKDILYGNEGADILVGGFGADTIITGTGADLIKIATGESPAAYASGYPSTSAFDSISDFTTGASEDRFSYDTAFSIVQSETTTPNKGLAAISSQGIATFAEDDNTLSEKIYAVNSGINTGIEKAGAVAAFQHGSNAFLFIHDGFTALGVADSLIRLEDLDLTSKSLNIKNDLLTIV